jgi:hypothetical protein
MPASKPTTPQPDPHTSTEARRLAEEAMQERRSGNQDEAEFVLEEARALDRKAVEQVVRQEKAQHRKG